MLPIFEASKIVYNSAEKNKNKVYKKCGEKVLWILIIFTSIIFYALAETLQKLGVNIKEEHCEIKLLIWFGIVSGATSLGLQLLGLRETTLTAFEIVAKQPLMVLSPLLYYLSLFFCFVGFKLIPVSVASPITCMDGVCVTQSN